MLAAALADRKRPIARGESAAAFMTLMADDTNLAADMRLGNPEIAELEALSVTIRKMVVPDSIVDDVCRRYFSNKYVPPHSDQLPIGCLRTLVGALREEKAKYLEEFGA